MASNLYLDKILQRITENTNTMCHVGIIIASSIYIKWQKIHPINIIGFEIPHLL